MESPKCRSAMYMLRFSDSTITDSQGLKSVFGLVTAAVLMVKKAKGIASGGSRGGFRGLNPPPLPPFLNIL